MQAFIWIRGFEFVVKKLKPSGHLDGEKESSKVFFKAKYSLRKFRASCAISEFKNWFFWKLFNRSKECRTKQKAISVCIR